MIESQTINSIRVNHIGYLPGSSKIFMVESPPEKTFSVHYLKDTFFTEVYRGILTREEGELDSGWLGDFSSVTAEGNYQIHCGNLTSRRFVIWNKAYDPATRLMLGYFTWQRCGSSLGWAGTCHQEDGIISESGEKVDLTGGYHQSCDLRKSPGGVSIGLLGMLKYALIYKPCWDCGSIADEIKWACDHYIKTVQPEGSIYNTLGVPFGWGGRTYYRSPAPASAHWNILRVLALGALYFKETDLGRYTRYIAAAQRIWYYQNSPDRPEGIYRHPDVLPRGMDPEFAYRPAYKGSTADLCYRVCSAADLYRATGEISWLDAIEKTCAKLLKCFVDAGGDDNIAAACLRMEEGSGHLIENSAGYAWLGGGMLALCDALELLPHSESAPTWRERLSSYAGLYVNLSHRNIWRRIPNIYSEADLNLPCGHPVPGKKQSIVKDDIGKGYPLGWVPAANERMACYYAYNSRGRGVSSSVARMILLRRAARVISEKSCGESEQLNVVTQLNEVTQRNLDYLMGANPMDASHIEGVGFNQTPVPVFGQFFPSTPQIPGAVNIGFIKNDHAVSNGSEYDMPCVGLLMWLLADMLFAGQ